MSLKPGPKMSDPSYQQVKQVVQRSRCPFVTSNDVAEKFPEVTDRTIRKRLNDLVDRNELRSRQVGAQAKVWYLPH